MAIFTNCKQEKDITRFNEWKCNFEENGIFIDTSLFLIIYVLFSSLKIDKVYDTKNLVGKPIPELDLKLLNETKTFTYDWHLTTVANYKLLWCILFIF